MSARVIVKTDGVTNYRTNCSQTQDVFLCKMSIESGYFLCVKVTLHLLKGGGTIYVKTSISHIAYILRRF